MALEQVLLYWKRLRNVAEEISETEVPLSLPGQVTPRNRKFCIDGVVDIVRTEGRTVMYDLKTHDCNYVIENVDRYQDQLNVYAHIWQNLRAMKLDEMAVIATRPTEPVRAALESRDQEGLAKELDAWNPVVPIPFLPDEVQKTGKHFGETVDKIEERRFAPRTSADLKKKIGGKQAFGSLNCRTCDARYSCKSYIEFAKATHKGQSFFRTVLDDLGDQVEVDEAKDASLEAALPVSEVLRNR